MQQGKKFAYTAQRLNFPIYQTVICDAAGEICPLFPPEKAGLRSQDMPQAYIDAGQLYWFETAAFLEKELSIRHGTALIPIPAERALDIDTEEDWQQAEKLARMLG